MRRFPHPAPRVPSLGHLLPAPILILVFALLAVSPASAQYVFLDANGDGVNDRSDQLNPTGPTDLDVYFVTDHNRDGSPAVCRSDPAQPLTINSYEIVLRAFDGTVKFGPMRNRLPFSDTPACFAGYADTTNSVEYHNGYGFRDNFPTGRYLVATLRVEILDGAPSLSIRGRSLSQPSDVTSFGTVCEGADYDNTHALGEDFFDAGGIGGPHAEAGRFYTGLVGDPITFNGAASSSTDGSPLTFSWSFDDGGAASGAIVTHTFVAEGNHTATLTVSDGTRSDSDVAQVSVTSPREPSQPVAISGGPYRGRTGIPVMFDGSLSYDPDGDPLYYDWWFGDGSHATAAMPVHIYDADGTYDVQLVVSDGTLRTAARTTATISSPVNHAPVVDAGGPYTGYAGRWIQFAATQSTDPDGDVLRFNWNFGDGYAGFGIVSGHAYARAGTYTATVSASDGLAIGSASTTATIAANIAGDAFFDGGKTVVDLDDPDESIAVRFQPVDESFAAIDVDPHQVLLNVETVNGTTASVQPSRPAELGDDSDHDGVAEYVALFPREWFLDLATRGAIQGRTQLRLTDGLNRGGVVAAAFEATFIHANRFDLTVTPNPFNPIARIVIRTKTAGAVTAKLFDVHGRRVKTILGGEPIQAGRHVVVFDARDDHGARLASGLYFLQVVSADGTRTGRVIVAK